MDFTTKSQIMEQLNCPRNVPSLYLTGIAISVCCHIRKWQQFHLCPHGKTGNTEENAYARKGIGKLCSPFQKLQELSLAPMGFSEL